MQPIATGPLRPVFWRSFHFESRHPQPAVQLQSVAVWSGFGLFSVHATGPKKTIYELLELDADGEEDPEFDDTIHDLLLN